MSMKKYAHGVVVCLKFSLSLPPRSSSEFAQLAVMLIRRLFPSDVSAGLWCNKDLRLHYPE